MDTETAVPKTEEAGQEAPKTEDAPKGGATGSWDNTITKATLEDPSISKFRSTEELASSYINMAKTFSKNHPGPTKEDTWESFQAKASNFFNIPKDMKEYAPEFKGKFGDASREIGFKHKVHPMQLEHLEKAYFEKIESNQKADVSKRAEAWKNESEEKVWAGVDGKDEITGRALKKAGLTLDQLQAELGEVSKHKTVQTLLKALGDTQSQVEASQKPVTSQGQKAEDVAPQEMYDYVKKMMSDKESPYFNKKNPSHYDTKQKVDSYTEKLAQYQRKNPDAYLVQNMKLY